MKFHHIGIACRDIKKEIESISQIHSILWQSSIIFDEKQNAELCFLSLKEGLNMELIAGEQIKNILKRQINYYHVCYEVENIEKTLERLEKLGGYIVSQPKPAILFDNRLVAFINMPYGMVELLNIEKTNDF